MTNLGVAAVAFWVMLVRAESWAVLYWKQVVYQVASWEFRQQTWDHPQTFWSHWRPGKLEDCNTTTSTLFYLEYNLRVQYNPKHSNLHGKNSVCFNLLNLCRSMLKNTANENAEKLTLNYGGPAFS